MKFQTNTYHRKIFIFVTLFTTAVKFLQRVPFFVQQKLANKVFSKIILYLYGLKFNERLASLKHA